jgi:hypothetical protein
MGNNYKRLFIWVEGEDDYKFFEKIIIPVMKDKYNNVKIIRYANSKKDKVVKYLNSINAMNADYIFIRDINNAPCITNRKEQIKKEFGVINIERIFLVVKEIEGWYLAGISDKNLLQYKLGTYKKTDMITKEQFNNKIPKKFDSRIDFMTEILKNYAIETAKGKNRSFAYLINHLNIAWT